jgi:cytochrome c biogenesis protein CcdA
MIAFKSRFAIWVAAIFAFFVIEAPHIQAEGNSGRRVPVEYFYQPNCEDCKKITALILPPMHEQYGNRIALEKYDLSEQKNFLRLIAILDRQKNTGNEDVYMVVAGKYILGGYTAVEKQLFPAIESELRTGGDDAASEAPPSTNAVKTTGEKLKMGMVIAAGLIDGINPCVFSTLVFFMSLLSVAKIRGRKLILVGLVYCAAGFITYLLLGFGLFKLIKTLDALPLFKTGLNAAMFGVLVIFAMISFRDAWLFYKSGGDSAQVMLQLPGRLKAMSHNVMKKGLKFHWLIAGSFVIGVTVTLLESVCTGQVYVPTLTLLSNESGVFSKWFGLLLLYNLMFILPLIGVFIMTCCGISILTAVKLTRANLLIGKILMGLFFLILAAILMAL